MQEECNVWLEVFHVELIILVDNLRVKCPERRIIPRHESSTLKAIPRYFPLAPCRNAKLVAQHRAILCCAWRACAKIDIKRRRPGDHRQICRLRNRRKW